MLIGIQRKKKEIKKMDKVYFLFRWIVVQWTIFGILHNSRRQSKGMENV